MSADPEFVNLLLQIRALDTDPAADADQRAELVEELYTRYAAIGRGGVTPGGLPYPDPTDPVSEGADAIRALAEATDSIAGDSGWVNITTFGNGWSASASAGYQPRVRALGHRVDLVGAAYRAGTGASTGNILTIPAGYRIPAGTNRFVGVAVVSTGQAVQLYFSDAAPGVLAVPAGYQTGAPGAPLTVPLQCSWYRD